ncbi:MAG TPA: hypothetical protein VFB79_16620 [Candidatus Angelobacter sp.]|nr:hypothetical protein [Candidatus Angelobacter sp.]
MPIKGRPIRLADVLLTAGDELAVVGSQSGMACFLTWHPNTIKPKVGKWINDENILWSLKDDNLDNQSDECKEFLINLLVRG